MTDKDEIANATSFTVSEDGKTVSIKTFDGHEITGIPMDTARDGPKMVKYVADWRVENQKRLPPSDIQRAGMVSYADQPDPPRALDIASSDYEAGEMRWANVRDDEEALPDFGKDAARTFLSISTGIGQLVAEGVKSAATPPGWHPLLPNPIGGATEEEKRKIERDATRKTAEAFAHITPGIEREDVYNEETGKIREPETLAGMGLVLGTYMASYTRILGTKAIQNMPKIFQYILAAGATESIMFDPEVEVDEEGQESGGNTFSMLEQYLIDSTSPGAVGAKYGFNTSAPITSKAIKSVVQFLSTDPDDSRPMQRMKQIVVDGILLGGILDVLGDGLLGIKAIEKFDAPFSTLNPPQMEEVVMDGLEEARELMALANQIPGQRLSITETDADVRQVIAQSKEGNRGGLRRTFQAFTQQRGFLTRAAKNAFDSSVYAQRATAGEAENVVRNLQHEMRVILDNPSIADKNIAERVQEVITTDINFPENRENWAQFLKDDFGIPENLAPHIIRSREMIDDLSRRLVHSDFLDQGVKDVIEENIGSYLRRSYRLFEDTGWQPSQAIRTDAEDFIRFQILESTGGNIDDALLETRVQDLMNEILVTDDVFQFADSSRRLNIEILKGKKDIPPEIRALMGEIEEPAENIMLTISKMSKLYEVGRFHTNMYDLGKGKYIFDDNMPRDTSIFNTRMKMPGSPLDGKWTTPETAEAIKSNFIWNPGDFLNHPIVKNFAEAKGVSQQSKTILSISTQSRNGIGGSQFGLANGMNPFADGNTTRQILWDHARGLGNKEFEDLYNKFQGLGVINTNTKQGEFRSLLETGADSTAENLFSNLGKIPVLGEAGETTIAGANKLYMAVDDFYKINGFNVELDTLKRAYPNRETHPLELLEQEAARKIKNTFPNYDRVPPGMKATRFLPMGNFISFPAEIWRTSYHVIKEGSREVRSGNPVLMKRGAQRLAGYFGTMTAWGLVAKGTYSLLGFTEAEEDAINHVSKTPWNAGTTQNIVRVGDKFYTNDTQFLNSYHTIRSPIMQFKEEIERGELYGEDLDKVLIREFGNVAVNMLKPFVEETMLVKALSDVMFAIDSESGLTPDGKRLFAEGEPIETVGGAVFEYLIAPFMPGTFDSAVDVWNAAWQKPNKYSGKTENVEAELIAALIGIKFKEVDPAEALRFAYIEYQNASNNDISSFPSFETSPEEVIDAVRTRQNLRFRDQQKLYEMYRAVDLLLGESDTFREARGQEMEDDPSIFELRGRHAYSILRDLNMPAPDAIRLAAGRFNPENSFYSILRESMERQTPFMTAELEDKEKLLYDAYFEMFLYPLHYAPTSESPLGIDEGFGARDERLEREREEERERREELEGVVDINRLNRRKGGEVNIPQAPAEPDERIDKMTGLPYDQQAGGAFIDEEDRAGLTSLYTNIFGAR